MERVPLDERREDEGVLRDLERDDRDDRDDREGDDRREPETLPRLPDELARPPKLRPVRWAAAGTTPAHSQWSAEVIVDA